MTDRELMQQALEALDGVEALLTSMDVTHLLIYGGVDNAITALRERLAQPEQDAVLAEREACARVCDVVIPGDEYSTALINSYADDIRARGEK